MPPSTPPDPRRQPTLRLRSRARSPRPESLFHRARPHIRKRAPTPRLPSRFWTTAAPQRFPSASRGATARVGRPPTDPSGPDASHRRRWSVTSSFPFLAPPVGGHPLSFQREPLARPAVPPPKRGTGARAGGSASRMAARDRAEAELSAAQLWLPHRRRCGHRSQTSVFRRTPAARMARVASAGAASTLRRHRTAFCASHLSPANSDSRDSGPRTDGSGVTGCVRYRQ